MAEAQQRQLLILTINEQIGGEYQAERSVKPELWHSASFCSIIPFEIGARVGLSPTPAIKGPGVFAPRNSHPFHCDGTLQFPQPLQTLCGGPCFHSYVEGRPGGPRGSVTASGGPGLLPRTDVQLRALPSLPRPSGKKHSLLPNQSPQYPLPPAW